MPTENENSNGEFFYFNKETGKWTPFARVESISCEFTLSEEAAANLASIFEPLGDLEIIPNPKKPGETGGDDNDS
ncbi:MAG: hypothetical protein J6Y02_21470 [Pseudobutyrivibrio sp.]|nr:hypothetical protein [Pseudobutyrivibrio sp.]